MAQGTAILAGVIFIGLLIVAWMGVASWWWVGVSVPVLIGAIIAAARLERAIFEAWRY